MSWYRRIKVDGALNAWPPQSFYASSNFMGTFPFISRNMKRSIRHAFPLKVYKHVILPLGDVIEVAQSIWIHWKTIRATQIQIIALADSLRKTLSWSLHGHLALSVAVFLLRKTRDCCSYSSSWSKGDVFLWPLRSSWATFWIVFHDVKWTTSKIC